MNKLKCRKQKINGSFECKRTNKIINIKECNNCKYKEYKEYKSIENNQFKKNKKSSKLAKLERNRKSVFTDNKDKCMFCPSTYRLTWHEIFAGRNRQNSMKYNLCLRMCLDCHEFYQEDSEFNDFWHKQGQLYFERNISSREEFIRIFGKSYL